MKRNRQLTKGDLSRFQSWLKNKGWTIGAPTGNFVVLRAKKDREFVTLYGSKGREDLHWTKIHNDIVNDFLKE